MPVKESGESKPIQVAIIGGVFLVIAAIIGILPSLLRDTGTTPPPTFPPFSAPPAQSFVASLYLSKEAAPKGAIVNASGQGFAPNEKVTIRIVTTVLATPTTDASGQFANVQITIPTDLIGKTPKQYEIYAVGDKSLHQGFATITVTG